ncbi:MAG: tripartite tricarboxylate transporter TctB family protein [Clostridia bacterium]|jgi:hypothetical protein|nr:tripartite tricarboxylate transporter TctB family protein [Spirochaetia bacterium]
MKKDFFSGIFCILLGAFIYLTIPSTIPHDDLLTQMGPRFFPSFLSLALILLGLVLSVQSYPWKAGWKASKEQSTTIHGDTEAEAGVVNREDEAKVLMLFIIMVFASVLLGFFRYIVAMPIAATAMLALYKVKKWQYYLILYVFILLFYFVFVKLMYVQL